MCLCRVKKTIDHCQHCSNWTKCLTLLRCASFTFPGSWRPLTWMQSAARKGKSSGFLNNFSTVTSLEQFCIPDRTNHDLFYEGWKMPIAKQQQMQTGMSNKKQRLFFFFLRSNLTLMLHCCKTEVKKEGSSRNSKTALQLMSRYINMFSFCCKLWQGIQPNTALTKKIVPSSVPRGGKHEQNANQTKRTLIHEIAATSNSVICHYLTVQNIKYYILKT